MPRAVDRAAVPLAAARLLLASADADAVDLEKLVMPGPVVKGHAEIEAECGKCHAPFRKASQDALCLDCHTKVNEDLHAGERLPWARARGSRRPLAAIAIRSTRDATPT